MTKVPLRAALLSLLLVGLTAVAGAQTIPAGADLWATPANGHTYFDFPAGDVELLCGAPPSPDWNHRLTLQGAPGSGPQGDTTVQRLDDATFGSGGVATTRVQISRLVLTSISPQATPCGNLSWTAGLFGTQPVTTMTLNLTSKRGGTFSANLAVSVRLDATDSGTGRAVGSLFYTLDLPDPGGSAWSFGPLGNFRAGIDAANNCVESLRLKQNTTAGQGSHAYCIADAIAQGNCNLPCLQG